MSHNGKPSGGLRPAFSPLGIWAFSIGTSIGWGSFIVTCNTYLLKSGLLGTVFGMLLGMGVILIITWNLQDYDPTGALGRREGGIVIACGMARFDGDSCVASVFERADQQMYLNKNDLKQRRE